MQILEIIKKSIIELDTEIVVNAANRHLQAGGGVCGYIFGAAGKKELQEACDRIGRCETGNAVITPGFKLCKYIIHAVGPEYVDGKHKEAELLYSCYRKSLDLAKEYGCHSIGFPLISSGIFGYPVWGAWEEAARAIADWTKEDPDYDIRIIFAVIDDQILEEGRRVFGKKAEKVFLVKRQDWKAHEMPEQNDHFELTINILDEKLGVLRHGHLPQEMEDKWFWYMEGDLLYAHRSWTGFCIYIADFSEKGKIKVIVNRDPDQYKRTDVNEDKKIFCDLLHWWIHEPYDHYNQWLHETAKMLKKAEMAKDK